MSYKDGILYSLNLAIARFNPVQVIEKWHTRTTNRHINMVRVALTKEGIGYTIVDEVSTYVDFSQEPWRDPKRIPKEKEGI